MASVSISSEMPGLRKGLLAYFVYPLNTSKFDVLPLVGNGSTKQTKSLTADSHYI
jgi:hypothetical protein